jgi:hypothetical protein
MEASRREHGMALCCLVPTRKSATQIVLQIVLGHEGSRSYRVKKINSVLTQVVACVRKPRAAWQSRLHGLGSQLSAEQMPDERRGETYLATSCKPGVGSHRIPSLLGDPDQSWRCQGPAFGHQAIQRSAILSILGTRLCDSVAPISRGNHD